MGSLLLEVEITGKELLGQLKAGGGVKYKNQYDYEIQIEKVNDSTNMCLKLKIFSLNITNRLHCSREGEILILFGRFFFSWIYKICLLILFTEMHSIWFKFKIVPWYLKKNSFSVLLTLLTFNAYDLKFLKLTYHQLVVATRLLISSGMKTYYIFRCQWKAQFKHNLSRTFLSAN